MVSVYYFKAKGKVNLSKSSQDPDKMVLLLIYPQKTFKGGNRHRNKQKSMV